MKIQKSLTHNCEHLFTIMPPAFRQTFWRLTLRVEGFTYFIPVPVAIFIYQTSLLNYLQSKQDLLKTLLSALFAATWTFCVGTYWRYHRLKKASVLYTQGKADTAKILLLKHPFWESVIMVSRWFFGILSANIGSFSFIPDLPLASAHSGVIIFLLVAPLEAIGMYIITESTLSSLHQQELNTHHFTGQSKRPTRYRRKIIGAVIAVSALPFFLLSYFLYVSTQGMLKIENPLPVISTIASLMVIPIAVMSYYLGSGVSKGLDRIVSTLAQLNQGKFSAKVPVYSTDEFSNAAGELNQVIVKLREQYENIQELNKDLDQKVKARTEELNQSLEKLKTLSLKQDGDYFLTSLLFEPLNGNFVKENDRVKVECLTEQKKQLKFRERDVRLGGDLAIAYEISLQGENYWALLNADCMGKSMQGAGGAITLAAIFKSIVYRTNKEKHLSPEHWLYECYLELQNIFTSFDGFMLASANIALLHLRHSTLYWIHIEHPVPVLMRHGKATFLEPVHSLWKLGVENAEKNFGVNVFFPEEGDRVYFASDGRDDVICNTESNLPENNDREERFSKINSNEFFFLELVSKTDGSAKSIKKKLFTEAEATDDFSLVAIEFREGAPQNHITPEAKKKVEALLTGRNRSIKTVEELLSDHSNESAGVAYLLSNYFIRRKEYSIALLCFRHFMQWHPVSNSQLLTLTKLCVKTQHYFDAIHFSERLFFRDPTNENNNRLLRKLYEKNREYRINDPRLFARGTIEEQRRTA